MRKLSYNTLMKILENGRCTVNAWSDGKNGEPTLVDVTFYNGQGNATKREHIEVTHIPAE